jgi:DNA-binding transcriptional MocR family regulator
LEYGDIHFGSERPIAAKCFDEKGLVLLCSSLSKTLAPGYRVGWISPGMFKERIELVKLVNNFSTSTPPQMATADFLMNGGYDRHLRKRGMSLWVEFPKYVDSLKLYSLSQKHGISFVPGPLFSAKGRYLNYIRLNNAYWSERAEKAIATIGHLAAGMNDNGP